LQARGDIGRLAEGQLFVSRPAPDLTHDHLTRMDAQTHIELHPVLLRHAGVELPHGLHHPHPGTHRSLGIILMGIGVAEVDQQAITEVLRDMPLEAGDHFGAGVLIRPHHLAPFFRVELASEHGGVQQVTEQHRELAAFGFWGMRGGWWRSTLGR
jgi:hypothetical protein